MCAPALLMAQGSPWGIVAPMRRSHLVLRSGGQQVSTKPECGAMAPRLCHSGSPSPGPLLQPVQSLLLGSPPGSAFQVLRHLQTSLCSPTAGQICCHRLPGTHHLMPPGMPASMPPPPSTLSPQVQLRPQRQGQGLTAEPSCSGKSPGPVSYGHLQKEPPGDSLATGCARSAEGRWLWLSLD